MLAIDLAFSFWWLLSDSPPLRLTDQLKREHSFEPLNHPDDGLA